MRIALVILAVLLLAGTAMAADMARGPAYVESTNITYEDQYQQRADALVISIIEGTFWDLGPTYADAFTANGLVADVIYDPAGTFDPSTYSMVVYSTSDNWWDTYAYGSDLTVLATYVDGGGCLMIVGQDFLWGSGVGGGMAFVQTYCYVVDVTQDVLWSGVGPMDYSGTAGGFIEGISCVISPWSDTNFFFTDDVYMTGQGVVTWTSDGYGPAEGGSQDVAIFSAVEFGAAPELNDIIGAFMTFCGVGPEPTPTNHTTWGQLKAQ